ncbi:MAG TPA: hypothetical protein VM600_02780 [Actinomycetota bacterium]|nr:hypothetical protein [Actinomycetota bacterium]
MAVHAHPHDPNDEPGLVLDCGDCVMQASAACSDCIVSYLVDREPGQAVVFDADEERALRSLTRAGLVPDVRYRRRTG